MKEVHKRTITGTGIMAVIILSVMAGPDTFFILCAVISLTGLFEFYRLFGITRNLFTSIGGMILSTSLLICVFLIRARYCDWSILVINLPLISYLFATVLFMDSEDPFAELAVIFLGQVYVTLPFILLYTYAFSIDEHMYSKELILGYFFLLWGNDTGAYVSGSLIGKHALAPVISPKKTWEGSAGGALLVVILVFVNSHFFTDLSLTDWAVLATIVVVMGTLGDLVKSVLKRSKGVKDSGKLLPGHGGILDRFDSLIGSIPFVYIYVLLSGQN